MLTTYNFMLTVAMGKRLIAKGLMANSAVRDAMENHDGETLRTLLDDGRRIKEEVDGH